jgi:cephalosporin hydroxylase
VHEAARGKASVLVVLDSNHTHEHVLAELEAYAPLVSAGSYCIVFDTVVEHLPKELFPDRPWGPGDNPKTAVHEWLRRHPEFEIDRQVADKLLLTVAPDGYLRRTR